MTDPTDLASFDEITRLLKRDIDLAVVTEGQLLEVIDRVYRRTEEITGLARELSEDLGDTVIDFGIVERLGRAGGSTGSQAVAEYV